MDPKLAARLSDPTVEDFFTVMAICNTVVVSGVGSGTVSEQSGTQNGNVTGAGVADKPRLKYEAESPDEAALVQVGDCVFGLYKP